MQSAVIPEHTLGWLRRADTVEGMACLWHFAQKWLRSCQLGCSALNRPQAPGEEDYRHICSHGLHTGCKHARVASALCHVMSCPWPPTVVVWLGDCGTRWLLARNGALRTAAYHDACSCAAATACSRDSVGCCAYLRIWWLSCWGQCCDVRW